MPCRISMCESGRGVCVFLCVCVCVCVCARVGLEASACSVRRPSHTSCVHMEPGVYVNARLGGGGFQYEWVTESTRPWYFYLTVSETVPLDIIKPISLHKMNISSCLPDEMMNILISRNMRPFEKSLCVIKERREEAGGRCIKYKYLYIKLVYCIDLWGLGHSANK